MTKRKKPDLFAGKYPKRVRVYDNGGSDGSHFCRFCYTFHTPEGANKCPKCGVRMVLAGCSGTCDRYTVVYAGNYPGRNRRCHYIGMSGRPTHPQGFGQHGEHSSMIDARERSWGYVGIGDLHHNLGRRIPVQVLPEECLSVVRFDYKSIWGLK